MKPIVLLGLDSRYAFDALELLASSGASSIVCMASIHDSSINGDYPNVVSLSEIDPPKYDAVVPLLTPGRRKLRDQEAGAIGFGDPDPFFHQSAVISPTAHLGARTMIGAMSVIASNIRAGRSLLVNRSASIGHDCDIRDFCTIAAGATLCSKCTLEDGVFVGAGATISPGVTLRKNSVIGAGANVLMDVPNNCVVVGNPAKIVREGVAGYRDIGV